MVFPDDLRESNPGTFKFVQMAQAWRAQGSSILRPAPSSVPSQPSEPGNVAMDEDEQDEASSSGGDVAMETQVQDDASSSGG